MALGVLRRGRLSPRLAGNGYTIASCLIWATSFPATAILLQSWHPMLLTPVRLGLAACTMLLLTLVTGDGHKLLSAPWKDIFRLGGIGVTGSVVCQIWGLHLSDPVTASIVIVSSPLVAAVMGWIEGRERLRPAALIGLAFAVAGGLVASLGAKGGPSGLRGGELLVLLSVVLWTWYSRGAMQRLQALGDIVKGATTMAAATLVLTVVVVTGLLLGLIPPHYDLSLPTLPLLVWMGAIGIGLSLPFWLAGVRLLGVTTASLHQNLTPLYVMLIMLLLGGSIAPLQILGGVLVILGAILAQLPAWAELRRK